MKKLKNILNIIFILVVVSILLFIGAMNLYPKETSSFIGYQLYVVLTDSMEPRIPTYSLIGTKVIDAKEELQIKKGDIITFKAKYSGKDALVTHYFNKMQKNKEGIRCYRTNPENSEALDGYETKREDVVGTYVFHIPYIGKIILFLQSKFGLLLFAELFVIWCVNKLILARWEEKGKETKKPKEIKKEEVAPLTLNKEEIIVEEETKAEIKQEEIYISDEQLRSDALYFYASGNLHNMKVTPIQNFAIKIVFYHEEMYRMAYKIHVSKHTPIASKECHSFTFRVHKNDNITFTRCSMEVLER